MRILAGSIGREPAFSFGGSLEIIAYGAIVGLVSGAVVASARRILPGRWWIQGLIIGLTTYAVTILTLPAHIADTARPFSGMMPTVLALFGTCFLLFGLALARINSRASSPVREAAPIAPPG